MDSEIARWLVSAAAEPYLQQASAEPDPSSLAAGVRLRATLPADRAAAVLDQVAVRRRGTAKLSDRSFDFFLSTAGLEQATRPAVAAWRAAQFVAAGVTHVWDLCCGLGFDAAAFVAAGLTVTMVERDEATAVLAAANVPEATVLHASVEDVIEQIPADAGVFADPARRTSRGRSWDVAALSPPWETLAPLLDGRRIACVKLGPGVPYRVIPASADTVWTSESGDLVEACLWSGPIRVPGRRSALLLPAGDCLTATDATPALCGDIPSVIYEPDPAVIRCGGLGALAARLGACALADQVAYLGAGVALPTPYATAYRVEEVLPYDVKSLKAWVRRRGVGRLEIKKRGIDVDPAALRRTLRPAGPAAATLILCPSPQGAVAVVVVRVT